jgi:hypothetical protein
VTTTSIVRLLATGITAAALVAPVAALIGGPGIALASSNGSAPSVPADTQQSLCPGAYERTVPGTDRPVSTRRAVPVSPVRSQLRSA